MRRTRAEARSVSGVGLRADRDTKRRAQKKQVRRKHTKARLRREFEAALLRLQKRLRSYPRATGDADRERILREALADLDLLIEEKPQSQVLRNQKRSCLDVLQDLLAGHGSSAPRELELLLEDPAAVRLALKARIHPPGSSVRSWN